MKLLLRHIEFHHGETKFHYQAEITSQITGIFGNSGMGKTTFMNLINGIETPDSGHLEFNGKVLFNKQNRTNLPVNQRNFGVVFQDNFLFPHLTAKQNLLYAEPYLRKRKKYVHLDQVIDLMEAGTILSKKPHQLSGGERQRIAIGRSLMSQPELLLLDEPFSNLDRNRRQEIISFLLKISREFDLPMMIISHDLENILKLTHTILLIQDGQVKAHGNYFDMAREENAKGVDLPMRHINPSLFKSSSGF